MVRNYECYDFRFSICQEFTTVTVVRCHKVTGYELSSLFLSLLLPLSSSFVCVCLLLIFIFIVAKVVFTCEDVKSDGSRFEDGGFASVVARVRRTGVPNIVMIIFAFNYFCLALD